MKGVKRPGGIVNVPVANGVDGGGDSDNTRKNSVVMEIQAGPSSSSSSNCHNHHLLLRLLRWLHYRPRMPLNRRTHTNTFSNRMCSNSKSPISLRLSVQLHWVPRSVYYHCWRYSSYWRFFSRGETASRHG